jgi:DNA-binding response OmpR family regulator
MRLLVVEDDETVGSLLSRVLRGAGYDVEVMREGAPAPRRVGEGDIDLVILDLTLPDVDGLDVCRRVRSVSSSVPIVMLTGRGGEVDVVAGLSAGADDYLAKPFRIAELTARVRAHLRVVVGRGPVDGPPEGGPHGLHVDAAIGRAWQHRRELELTPTEFQVLAVLIAATGRVVDRETILGHLREQGLSATPRSLDMHISAVRRTLATPDVIATVRGVGFRFEPE